MGPNVTIPLLAFDILTREFNPQNPSYVLLGKDFSSPNIMDQIWEFREVEVHDSLSPLDFISSPNCISLLSPEEWKKNNSVLENSIIKCTVLLALMLDEIPEVIIKLMSHSFRNVIAYTMIDTKIVHLVHPYHNALRNRSDGNPISSWTTSNLSALSKILEKDRMNLNGAEFIAALFPKRFSAVLESDGTFSGVDSEMLKLITSSINATLKIFQADRSIKYGVKLDNGSFNGILGDVYYWRVDIACNSMFIKEYGSPDFVFAPALQIEPLCIVVPSPLLVPNWMMVFRAFEIEVWHCAGFAMAISTILWYMLNLLARTQPDFTGSMLFVGRIFISTVKLPKETWQRIFASSLIFSAFVLIPSFEGSLLKLLKTRSYEREIKTMKEFRNSEYDIYTFSSNLVQDSTPDYLRGRVRLYRAVDEGVDLIEMVAMSRNLSYLGKKCDILQRISSNNWQVYVLHDYPRIYFMSYVMRKGNLLIRPISTALLRILASGLELSDRMNIKCDEPVKEIDYIIPKALDLSNLMIAFYTLKMGHTAAAVAFVVELLTYFLKTFWIYWFRKRRTKKSMRPMTLERANINTWHC